MASREPIVQRVFGRIAGGMFLFVLVAYISGLLITGSIAPAGAEFIDRAKSIVAAESLYRVGLVLSLIGVLATVVLAIALFMLLRAVDYSFALAGLLFRTCEAAIGGVGVMLSFATLQIRSAAVAGGGFSTDQWRALFDLMNSFVSTEVGAIFFSIGSTFFFLALVRSRFIPAVLAWVGVFGSLAYLVAWTTTLLAPGASGVVTYASLPMLIAEVGTGLWLLIRGIDQTSRPVSAPPRLSPSR